MNRRFRLLIFSLLYFVQGAAMAYFSNFQKPYLRSIGIDADAIGLLTTLLLTPFVLKIFFGMLSDRYGFGSWGRRKPYMVAGLVLAAAGFALCAVHLPETDFAVFRVAIVTAAFGIALFDAATDGYAIDATDPADSGLVQSYMVGGRALGLIALSLVFGQLASGGYRIVFFTIAALMLVPIVWVFALPRERAVATHSVTGAPSTPIFTFGFILFCLYAVLYSFASFGIDGLIPFHFSTNFALPEASLGRYGAARGVGAIAGAVAFGWLFRRIGLGRSAQLSLGLLAAGGAIVAGLAGENTYLAIGLGWGALWALQETCFVTLAMNESRHRYSGAIFAGLMALSNLGTAAGEGVTTSLTDNTSFESLFLMLAAFVVIPMFVLYQRLRIARAPSEIEA